MEMYPDGSPIETGLSLLYSHVSDATVWGRWWQNFDQMWDSWDCYEKFNWLRWQRTCDLKENFTVWEYSKYAHPVSTGFSRIILAAGVCCSTGLVSLIGLGETVLEAGVRFCAPRVNKERMKRKVKQNDGRELAGMARSLDCSTLSTYRTHWEVIFLNTPSYVLPVAPGAPQKRGSEYIIEAQRLLTSSCSLCPDTQKQISGPFPPPACSQLLQTRSRGAAAFITKHSRTEAGCKYKLNHGWPFPGWPCCRGQDSAK